MISYHSIQHTTADLALVALEGLVLGEVALISAITIMIIIGSISIIIIISIISISSSSSMFSSTLLF